MEAVSCYRKTGCKLYFVYSTCTGAVGISLNCGMGGSVGAATSLVQQPQEEARTAVALRAMASSKRIIMDLLYLRMVVGKVFSIPRSKK